MFWKIVFCAAFVAILAPCRVEAQQSIYGQCGGVGWSGPTSCVAGCTCSAENPYYAQCLSGGPTPPPTPQTASTTLVTTTSPPVVTYTPATTSLNAPSGTGSGSGSGSGPVAGNPFAGYQIYANPYYASEISASAIPSMTGAAAAAASAVAEVGVFFWLDTAAKVPYMDTFLEDIQTMNAAGASPSVMGAFVVYDLPDRDCAAAGSNGEYSIADNGVANYFAYIDSIAASVKAYPEVNIAFIIEPDSLANLVTNLGIAKCGEAQSAYLQCVNYAITTLNLPNVAMYLDAGHAGWLGWPANLGPAATLFAQVYKNASSPSQLRGLATNVANYNAWSLSGNQPQPSYTAGDPNYDEQLYVNALAPLVAAAGWPNAHFVTDTSRNGVQPTSQLAWGDFCNVVGTGFGVRPTTNTGSPELVDAFLWIKPGGECDGTSNTSSTRYDFHCGLPDALQPAPEAGTWFQAYFAQLVENANPSF